MHTSSKSTIFSSILSLALLASCATEGANVGQYLSPVETLPDDYVEKDSNKLDLLFVIDSSNSMRDEQESLAANIDAVVQQLQSRPQGLPSLHIGVVSADMGAGPYFIIGCDGNGDDGLFQIGNDGTGLCSSDSERFISVPAGTTSDSTEESFADLVACNTVLGISGCGFEQPLSSMRRGLELSGGLNGDFVREDAHLAVVILSDEDDCSALDVTMFDSSPSEDHISSTLGPLSSFRCTEFGLRCDETAIARADGTYEACAPDENSPYLHHPDDFVDFLRELKGSTHDVTVTVIAGDRNGLNVKIDDGEPLLAHSCQSGNGQAVPAYRLGYFAEQFSNHLFTSICDADLAGAMNLVGTSLREGLEEPTVDPEDPTMSDDTSDAGCQSGGSRSSTGALAFMLLALSSLAFRRRREQ